MPGPNLQPTLSGPLVSLRPLRADDWEEMFAVASDPMIWELHPEPTRCQEAIFRRFFEGGLKAGSALTIRESETGRIVGSSRYGNYNPSIREIEIGWTFLSRSCWGGNHNGEIKRLMLDHAFSFVDTVVFWVGAGNLRSRRAVEKIGGALREGFTTRDYSTGTYPGVTYEIRKGS